MAAVSTRGSEINSARVPLSEHICSYEGCDKTFNRPNKLEKHIRAKHTGERPFACDIPECTHAYTKLCHLKRHKQTAHKVDLPKAPQISCSLEGCGRTFSCAYNLKCHHKNVHEERLYKCTSEGCGRAFRKHQHLKIHSFEHTGVKPYACPHEGCDKRFLLPSVLKPHLKRHQGYTCPEEECGVMTSKWSLMLKHREVDHQSVSVCEICGKRFTKSYRYTHHLRTHSDERQMFECPRDACTRAYTNASNLREHVKVCHDGERFACEDPECSKTFLTKQVRNKHMKLHDPNRPLPKKKAKKKPLAEVLTRYKPAFTPSTQDSGFLEIEDNIQCPLSPAATITGDNVKGTDIMDETVDHSQTFNPEPLPSRKVDALDSSMDVYIVEASASVNVTGLSADVAMEDG